MTHLLTPRRAVACLPALLVALASAAPAHADDAARRVLEARLAACIGPGHSGQAIVALGADTILSRAFGRAANGVPMRLDTRIDAGSVAKQFTAAAVLALVDRGKVSLEDRVLKFLAGVPADKAAITVHQLLAHTSGIDPALVFAGVDLTRMDAMVRHVLGSPLVGPPGLKHVYGNPNYFLLAAIVEVASGKSFEAFVTEALFVPAGMKATGFCGAARAGEVQAHRFEAGADKGPMVDFPYAWAHRGATGIVTTAADLLLWHRALQGDRVLSPRAREALFRPVDPVARYACGWYVLDGKAGRQAIHGGNSVGAQALVERGLDRDYLIAVLLNDQRTGRECYDLANPMREVLLAALSADAPR